MNVLDRLYKFLAYRPTPGATYIVPEDPGIYNQKIQGRISKLKETRKYYPSIYLASIFIFSLIVVSHLIELETQKVIGLSGFNGILVLLSLSTLLFEMHYGHTRGFIFLNTICQICISLIFVYSLSLIPLVSLGGLWSVENTSPFLVIFSLIFTVSYADFSKHPIIQTSLSYIVFIGSFLSVLAFSYDFVFTSDSRHVTPPVFIVLLILIGVRTHYEFITWSRKFWFIDSTISAGLFVITVSLVNHTGNASLTLGYLYLIGYLGFLELLRRISWYRQDDIDIYLELDAQRRANAERDARRESLIRTMSHDLRSPLINAKDLLLSGDDLVEKGILTKDQVNQKVFENLDRIDVLSRDITAYFSAGARKKDLSYFDINEVIDSVASRYESRLDIVRISSVQGDVYADPSALVRCLENLFENIVTHSDKDDPQCYITDYIKSGYHYVDVEDNGVGIDEVDRQRILLPFVKAKSSSPGSGLGMSIVAMEINSFGGEIQILNPIILTGARFSLKIPMFPKRNELPFDRHLPEKE